jgi:glycerol-3-phosphate dehydrogenase
VLAVARDAAKLRQQQELSEQLQEALASRIVIEQAKGITAHRHGVTIDQAYQLIRTHARNNNTSLRTVARRSLKWIFKSEPGGHPAQVLTRRLALAGQLATTVQRARSRSVKSGGSTRGLGGFGAVSVVVEAQLLTVAPSVA